MRSTCENSFYLLFITSTTFEVERAGERPLNLNAIGRTCHFHCRFSYLQSGSASPIFDQTKMQKSTAILLSGTIINRIAQKKPNIYNESDSINENRILYFSKTDQTLQ